LRCGNLYRTSNSKLRPAMMRTAIQAALVRKSHGETTSAAVAVKPASTRTAGIHRFWHRGQKMKKGATNSSWPLNIAPAAKRQPHENQRFFRAVSTANK